MKRIPGITPTFEKRKIVWPDGRVLDGWEMFIGGQSYGRSESKDSLLQSWEARLTEAENARPFAFRPLRKRPQHQAPDRAGMKRTDETADRATQTDRGRVIAPARKVARH